MLGDFVYTEEEVEEGQDVHRYDEPKKLERAFKRFLVIAALVVCVGLVWWFFISPAMMPASVSVSSFPGLDRAAVLRYARIGERATYVSVNVAEAQALLARHPLVESARVVKNFPDRISIYLEPRRAVAVTVAIVDGRMQPVYFDRHGVAFMVGSQPAANVPQRIPVVSGLHGAQNGALSFGLGERLPEPILPLFSFIGEILDSEPSIWHAISEVNVSWNDNGTFDLVLFPVNNSIRLRVSSDVTADEIFYALLMLDVVRDFEDVPDEIDWRSGIGVLAAEGVRRGG